MKRSEIIEKIETLLYENTNHLSEIYNYEVATEQLTALFIQLSEKQNKEQKQICADEYSKAASNDHFDYDHSLYLENAILNAPLPTLD